MVDWLDAHFSEKSDSSDEEFVFHEEDAVEDTSGSSEEESSDVDKSSVANQNTPQHTYGNHTANGNSAATHRYTTPIQVNGNGRGLDENGYTNGKVGTNRHHPHLYSPYGRISPRRSNGERADDDELIYDRNGSFFPYSEQLPNRPLKELGVPFEIFSDTFNQFHDEQETILKELKETEHEMLQMNTQLDEDIEIVKGECNDLKTEYRDICEENKQIREYIEEMHSFLIPYFNNIVGADDNDEDNDGVKDMEIDKNNADENNEEKDEDVDFEFDEVTLGPFLIELFRQQQQRQQQEDERDQEKQENENQRERQGEQEKQRDQHRQ